VSLCRWFVRGSRPSGLGWRKRAEGDGAMSRVLAHAEVEEMTRDEGRRMLHEQTCDKLGVSREEFLRRLDAGEYNGTEDETVLRLAMLAPFGR